MEIKNKNDKERQLLNRIDESKQEQRQMKNELKKLYKDLIHKNDKFSEFKKKI